MKQIDLNGIWQLNWCDINAGSIDNCSRDQLAIPCLVPGAIHVALIDANLMKEPLEGLNSKEWDWIVKKEWWYERTFTVLKEDIKDITEIIFEGLDLTADVYLNKAFVARANNAFITHKFDISSLIKEGKNTLTIRIDEGVEAVKDKDVSFMEKSWDNGQPYRALMRKPQFCYGWDWTIPLPTLGVWQGVYIDSYEKATLEDIFLQANFGDENLAELTTIDLDVNIELKAFKQDNYSLIIQVVGDKRYENNFSEIFESSVKKGKDKITITIKNPKLWWPNNMGNQHLYIITFKLLDSNNRLLQTKELSYGIRKVSIDQSDLGKGEKNFTFVVNNEKMFSKGACWVPCDCILGRISDEKYHTLIKEAKNMNMNLMRVWGGGTYEKEVFYDYCHKYGILVWHDFMFACAYYPDYDKEFCNMVQQEAISVVKRLRNRACLYGWSGNNENYSMYHSYCENNKENPIPFHGRKIYEEILPEVCKEYDPDRIYRNPSPFGGDYCDSIEEGDQHTWSYSLIKESPNFLNLWLYSEGKYKFLSEFGVLSPMNVESVYKCIDKDQRFPGSDQWRHHSNVRDYIDLSVEKFFGKQEEFDLRKYTLMGQALQAEGLRYCFEEFKRNRFFCSGVLLWMYSDSYGTSGWTFIDYYLNKKALFYYAKRAFNPLGITMKGYMSNLHENMETFKAYYGGNAVKPLDIWAVNEYLSDKKLTLKVNVYKTDGSLISCESKEATLFANSSQNVLNVNIAALVKKYRPEELVIVAKLYCDNEFINDRREL